MELTDKLTAAVAKADSKLDSLSAAKTAFDTAQDEYNKAVQESKDAYAAVQAWVADKIPGAVPAPKRVL